MSKEQLALFLEKQLLVLQLPATYILEINRLINYASTYSSKMFTLNSGLSTFITTHTTTTLQRKRMAQHIAYQIEEWPDDIKIIPEDWVFDLEIESNWEYGVNGVSYKEEWTGIKTYHWLMPIGKVFILEKTVLSPFFVSELDLNNIANILSQAPLQKMIVKIALPDYTKEKLKRILLSKENLAGLEIEFL